jgi:uncharacterized RDD family membrane protein YckC
MDNQESAIFTERPAIYASFWERFAASFLDGLIVGAVNVVITFLMTGSFLGTPGNLLPTGIGLVIGWLYSALQESGAGQATLGKKAMGIKVTNMLGDRISFGQATGRHFGKMLSTIIIFIGYLMMLWDDKKQTLHDKMAGTLVVSRNSGM